MRSLVQDYETGYSDEYSVSVVDLANTLNEFNKKQNKKIDILQFDCCLMQMAEIAWQLRNCADFLLAPQTELPGSGTNYTMLYDNLCNGKNTKECAYNIIYDDTCLGFVISKIIFAKNE